jgi:oxygen-dependent protoporphyrinogen oxidase
MPDHKGQGVLQALGKNLRTERTRRDLAMLLSIEVPPLFAHVARWADSMPRYAVGHLDLVDTIERRLVRHGGLALAGNGYRGIGVPDCVGSGETAAETLIEHLFQKRV